MVDQSSYLIVENLTKTFEEVTAVDNLSLDIKEGEFVVFLGPSGCGKTTTLRCIAGLETPDIGRVIMSGVDLIGVPPKDRNTAMVFQNYALFPHMRAFDNIAFGLRMRGKTKKNNIEKKVKEAADMLGISKLLDRKPSKLSGGEQQRVALGRAIVMDPGVFLLDEPLANLDAKLREGMRTELQRLQRGLGVTTIFVTHDQEEAMTIADRIIILKKGKLQQIGKPNEVYAIPQNKFIAQFIGSPSMNLLECEMEQNPGEAVISTQCFTLSLEGVEFESGSGSGELGIRPEDLHIEEESASGLFEGKVDVVEPLGPRQLIYLTASGVELIVEDRGGREVEEGSVANVSVDLAKLHLFDESGGRIPLSSKGASE